MPNESHSSPQNLLGNPFGPLLFRYAVIWYHMIYNKSQMFSQGPFQVYQGHSLNIWNQKNNHFHDKKNMFFLGNIKLFCSSNLVCFCLINETRLRILSLTARLDRIALGKLWIMIDYLLCKQNLHTVHCSRAEGHKSRWGIFAGIRWFPHFRHFQWEPPMDLQEDPPTQGCHRLEPSPGEPHLVGRFNLSGDCRHHWRSPLSLRTGKGRYTVDGSEIRLSPVKVGSLFSVYTVFCTSQVFSRISEPSTVWE